jgi:preprotein translocase subunit SecF
MAIIALLHDVLIMCAVYFIFRIPLNDSFVAAVLTVIGYSMNDTIIIYDRIRENSNLLRKVPIGELVNKSVVQTLNRSINTVVTVLICITTLFIFASINNITSVKDFTLPLIVGISSGMYSSIFVASSLFVVWKESQAKKKIAAKAAKSRA